MLRAENNLPLVVIYGPTGSGKTALAIELALQYGGEIISADSRAIYTGMDIGTAKPTVEEQTLVPHWGIDLVLPGARFTVADFKSYAETKIDEIRARGKVPFLVGGTGLYIDAVVYDFQFSDNTLTAEIRAKWQDKSIEELTEYCRNNNIPLPENNKNKRYIINNIIRNGQDSQRSEAPRPDAVLVAIETPREELRARIDRRAETIFDSGVVEEATKLGATYGWKSEAMTGNIYPLVHKYLEGELTLDECKQKFATVDWQLAKRQLTWLRRNKDIAWLNLNDARRYLADKLEHLRCGIVK